MAGTYKRTKEQNLKHSMACKGKSGVFKRTDKQNKAMSKRLKGRKFSESHREKLRIALINRHRNGDLAKKHKIERMIRVIKKKIKNEANKNRVIVRKPKKGKNLKCPICNKTFYRKPSQLKLNQQTNCCSRLCLGKWISKNLCKEKSFLWKGGKSFEKYTEKWTNTLKLSIKQRDNFTCQICLKKGNQVHHIDYNKKNCDPQNLITLCRSCHAKTNHNRIYWQKYFMRLDI